MSDPYKYRHEDIVGMLGHVLSITDSEDPLLNPVRDHVVAQQQRIAELERERDEAEKANEIWAHVIELIGERYLTDLPRSPNWWATKFKHEGKLVEVPPTTLREQIEALQAEVERQKQTITMGQVASNANKERAKANDLIERLKLEAQIHAGEDDAHKASLLECYRRVGAQKRDWNGARPVIEYCDRVERERDEANEQIEALRERLIDAGIELAEANVRPLTPEGEPVERRREADTQDSGEGDG